MNLQEHIPLAPFTTFGVGGEARIFIEVQTEAEVENAIAYAREHALSLYPLGAGSNILVPDAGVNGVVVKMAMRDIAFENDGDETVLIAGAGALWEDIVDAASKRGLFGIENLAGVPGTMGGAAVQNIGAYGAEFSNVFAYADVINSATGARERIDRTKAEFAYRTSFFKKHREYLVLCVALRLSKNTAPNITYKDLVHAVETGRALQTPSEIVSAVRAIRAKKFPHAVGEGTAGSFFKNPIVSRALADELAARFHDLPLFSQENGMVKLPLAWILDHILSLKGFSKGLVRLYEVQPLVVVASVGATAADIDAFACDIAERVLNATTIVIEREVETFGGAIEKR